MEQTRAITSATDPRTEASTRWENRQSNQWMSEVRKALGQMASGLLRCMYCEDSRGTDIDHFWPQSAYPDRTFRWDNHLLACSFCNSNQKRTSFPLGTTGSPELVDPTAEDPAEHLTLTPSTGRFRARAWSSRGRQTIDVFGLNTRDELVRGRQDAWDGVQICIREFGRARKTGNIDLAATCERIIRQHPFSSVLVHLVRAADHATARTRLDPDCLVVLAEFPVIRTWI